MLRNPCVFSHAASFALSYSPRLQLIDRQRHRRIGAQRHQLARDARLVGVLDQVVAPLGRLHRRRRGQHAVEVAELVDELRRALRPDARHAGHVVGRIADQRLHVDHLVRRDAELLHHLGRADRLLLDRVQHLHAGADELHQVLVGRHDGRPGRRRRWPPWHRRRSGRRPPSRRVRSPGRRTPRSPRAPGRIAGSGRPAAAGGAPCSPRTGGCGTSCGRHRRSPRYACRHARAAAWPACWRSRTPRSPACRPAASSAAAHGRRGR